MIVHILEISSHRSVVLTGPFKESLGKARRTEPTKKMLDDKNCEISWHETDVAKTFAKFTAQKEFT